MLLASVGKFIPSSWKRLNPASAMEQVKLSGEHGVGLGAPGLWVMCLSPRVARRLGCGVCSWWTDQREGYSGHALPKCFLPALYKYLACSLAVWT